MINKQKGDMFTILSICLSHTCDNRDKVACNIRSYSLAGIANRHRYVGWLKMALVPLHFYTWGGNIYGFTIVDIITPLELS